MEEEFIENGNELDKTLFELTVEELKELAKIKNIPMPGAHRKPDMVFYIQESGGASKTEIKNAKANIKNKEKSEKQNTIPKVNLNQNINNSIDKKAIFSEKNMFSQQYGRIEKGYNIVSKEAADFFITQKNVREASPQEVAEFYGIK